MLSGAALALALAACSTAGTEASGSSDSGTESSQTADPSTGSTSGTASATTSLATSSGGSDSSSQGESTGTTDADTGTSSPVTNAATTTSATGSTTIGETTGETSTEPTTGGNLDLPCESDADCVLVDDCCSCSAAHVDSDPSVCDEECMITVCESFGIKEAVCEQGQCVPARTNCDDSLILCDALPPDCAPGFVPGVEPNNSCWTGQCVPAILCNFVNECQDCAGYESYFCATDVTQLGFKPHCELLPPECGGEATCACASDACEAPFDDCADGDDGLLCNCPVC